MACAVPWWWCAWAGSVWEAIGLLSAVRKDSVLSRACARRVFERRNALAAVAQARIVCSTARQPKTAAGGRGARTLGRRPGEGAAPGPDEQPPRGVAEHDGHVLWPTRRGLERRSANAVCGRKNTSVSGGGEALAGAGATGLIRQKKSYPPSPLGTPAPPPEASSCERAHCARPSSGSNRPPKSGAVGGCFWAPARAGDWACGGGCAGVRCAVGVGVGRF